MKHLSTACFFATFFFTFAGCDSPNSNPTPARSGASDTTASKKTVIAATNTALQCLTKAIVGEAAEVIRPRVRGKSNSGLDTQEMLRLQAADLIVTNGPGADDADWMQLISLDTNRIHATTSDEFEISDFIQVQDYRTVHSHGDQGEHSHPWLVPHCWLAPKLAQAQSLSLLNRLTEEFPQHGQDFRQRYDALSGELNAVGDLAKEVAELLDSKHVHVVASDPRLLFFTRSLNLDDDYLLWFDLPEASDAITQLRKRTTDKPQTVLLWSQDAGSIADPIAAATGVVMVRVGLIEDRDDSFDGGDFVAGLRLNYENLKTAVRGMSD